MLKLILGEGINISSPTGRLVHRRCLPIAKRTSANLKQTPRRICAFTCGNRPLVGNRTQDNTLKNGARRIGNDQTHPPPAYAVALLGSDRAQTTIQDLLCTCPNTSPRGNCPSKTWLNHNTVAVRKTTLAGHQA